MTFPAPSRCPRARRRTTRAYPSSFPPPRRFSSSSSASPPRDRPTVSAPHSLLPLRRIVPSPPITQEHLWRKLISSINSRDHHRVASPPPSSLSSSLSGAPHSSTSSGEIYANPRRIPDHPTRQSHSLFLPPSVPRCLKEEGRHGHRQRFRSNGTFYYFRVERGKRLSTAR